ncbi:E3 ubiquitin-protein ligase ubr1 [Vanrija albida]|uniref:E3 ubiquitin-protein ligase n=1 Tax=Vanrija albida TaxID=181172 RepID=A0ABR3PVD0_9TREE
MTSSPQALQSRLHDLLFFGHRDAENPELSPQQRATVTRQLYLCILNRPEWAACFLGDGESIPPNGAGTDSEDPSGSASSSRASSLTLPSWDNLNEWLVPGTEQFGPERTWSLLDVQQAAEETRRKPPRKPKPGAVCGKVLQRYDRTYICKTCANDTSCILCVDCFNAGNHEGHEVLFGLSYTFATVCDCGDSSAWKNNGHLGCAQHPPLPEGAAPRPQPEVPQALCQALYDTIVTVLEFIIQVIQHSPLPSEFGKLPSTREEMKADTGPSGEPEDRRGRGPWAVTAWADDKHVLREVTRQFRDALGVTWDTADRYAKEMDEVGRKVLIVTHLDTVAFHTASMLQQIDIGVTLRNAADVYKEELVGLLLQWLSEMCKVTICGEEDLVRRYVAMALFQPRSSQPESDSPPSKDLADLYSWKATDDVPKRFDWLMRLDVRLWRKAKWQLREIYSGIFVLGWDIKREFATRYSINYGHTFEHYLYQDRDDSSLAFSMSYMLLGRSAACGEAIAESNLFRSVLETAFGYYALRPGDSPSQVNRFDVETPAFRGKKGLTLLSHLRALLKYKQVKAQLVSNHELFQRTLSFLNHFVGLQSQRRELDRHVEYEIDWVKSISVLPDLSKLAREFGESFQDTTPQDLVLAMMHVAKRIVYDMNLESSTLDPNLYSPLELHQVDNVLSPGSSYTVFSQDITRITGFSFHHYLHVLFAEMLKSLSARFPDQPLSDIVANQILRTNNPTTPLLLIEWPMQKHVVLAQIRLGMWAKNGAAMRHQYHHYRDLALREFTIDQEFFLLQFGLCALDQQMFITALIDRFGLANFFRQGVMSPEVWDNDMDPRDSVALYEELLLLIIYLVSDTAVVNGWKPEVVSRRHIIHILALGPLSYSDIVRKLPERSHERGSLVPILESIADFRPPTDTATGLYALKPSLYSEVDPYWRQYSRNEQRDAAEMLITRAKKDNPDASPVIKPLPIVVPPCPMPFSNLADFLASPIISALVHWTLAHCQLITQPADWPGLHTASGAPSGHTMPSMDALLNLALHLAMMALDADADGFAQRSVDIIDSSGSMSMFQNLWFMQTNSLFEPVRPKVDYILDKIVAHLPEHYTAEYRGQRDARLAAIEEDKKPGLKSQAQARQAALKAKFAAQQANFASSLLEEVDDEDDAETDAPVSYGSCIVCQESVHPGHTGGMLAFLQPSRIVRDAVTDRDWFEEVLLAPSDLDRDTRYLRYGMGTTGEPLNTDAYPSNNLRFGVYVSACNHLMHDKCIFNYNELTRTRQIAQVQRHQPENAMRHEYMCPLCKSIGNVLIPLDPTAAVLRPMPKSKVAPGLPPTLSERIRSVSEEGLLRVSDSAKIWDYHVETGELVPWFTDCDFTRPALDSQYRKGHKSVHRMVDRIRSLTRPLSEQSQRIRGKKTHMYLADDMVGYTVSVAEITHRGNATPGTTVAEQVPETGLKLIKHLIGTLQLELDLFFGTKMDRTPLRVGLFARFLPDWYRSATLPSPLLFRLPLGMVVEAAAIAPDLLHAVIVMSYYAELTRTMLGLSVYIRRSLAPRGVPSRRTVPPTDASLTDALSVFANFRPLMISVLRNAGPFIDIESVLSLVTDEMLAKVLYSFTLPFLRRAAILYYAVNDAYPVTNPDYLVTTGSEYNRLLSVLGIPRPRETLANPHSTETPIVARWLTQWAMQGRILPPLEYPGTYELARLPEAYEVAAIKFAGRRCDQCGVRPSFPAICLFCGKLVCLAGDCCSEGEQGECNLHMRECGGVVGMFADIKRWVLVYLFAGSGSFGPMPYLDQFGELETSLRRGHRQFMHLGRMEELRRNMWLQHGVPTMCARRLELTSDGGGWSCL